MNVDRTTIPKKYEDAVAHWVRHNFPDYPLLAKYWDKYFPSDEAFCLCAKMDVNTSTVQAVGDHAGEPKSEQPAELSPEAAKHLLAIIRAQASTEFGSIQQHQVTIDRAPNDQDRFWVLRVMAEELRHGYQMFHLLTSRNWEQIGGVKTEDMVEDVLAMETGSHVLEAFNLPYDSFVDNVVFAAVIDRVGKYQLTMQKVCAYRPMAQSMPPMLREEAFHLAAGVVPMRRWLEQAAKGDPLVPVKAIQHSLNKWMPRGLEMFGDERGGDTNIKLGFKDKKNREAQELYIQEMQKLVRDLNRRYLRARFPEKSPETIEQLYESLEREKGAREGVSWANDMLRLPHPHFFRRRGEPALRMVGVDGETYTDVEAYLRHLVEQLSEAYCANRDMRDYADTMRALAAGTVTMEAAMKKQPYLKRKTEICPCSKSARWVRDEQPAARGANGQADGGSNGHANGHGKGNGAG
jgi:1,2-phenylacetyl-CoA epoxidase catalytic subunit